MEWSGVEYNEGTAVSVCTHLCGGKWLAAWSSYFSPGTH